MSGLRGWRFPYSTCENKVGEHQPYSVMVNKLILVMLGVQLLRARNMHVKLFFFALMLFELLHTISHYKHMDGFDNYIHVVGYFVLFTLYLCLRNLTGRELHGSEVAVMVSVLVVDMYLFMHAKGFYMVLSLISAHILLLLFYYRNIPVGLRGHLVLSVALIMLITCLFINEIQNCDAMMKWKELPYHAGVEIVGFFILYNYTVMFNKWSKL